MLNILMVASECVPFAKSGGLGDVTGILPKFLAEMGNNVAIVLPLYTMIDRQGFRIHPSIDDLVVWMGNECIQCSVYKTTVFGKVPVYFINHNTFFGRPNIYHDNDFRDYDDNPKRFAFLSKAALELCHKIDFAPDIVHANDWHTAITSAYLKRHFRNDPLFTETASVLTIHNIAYQGRYHRDFFAYTGLDWRDFTPDKFECHFAINLLKGGIHFADMVNTVSKSYAAETRSAPGGHGLESFLNKKGDDYIGILNGVDYSRWDPEKDKLIPANYSKDDLSGKAVCKVNLQKRIGLTPDEGVPLIGIVSRLVEQKGLYLLMECIDGILENMDTQFAVLGAGDLHLERFFSELAERYPGRVGTHIGYNNELAHLVEAGSDLFLMPSLYEPCGLNQIYSLKYGTLPLVRATGGLNDTIENYEQETGEGTGFKFLEPSSRAIYHTIAWALDTYFKRKPHFLRLIRRAMERNFSWEQSAPEYIKMYYRAREKVRRKRRLSLEIV